MRSDTRFPRKQVEVRPVFPRSQGGDLAAATAAAQGGPDQALERVALGGSNEPRQVELGRLDAFALGGLGALDAAARIARDQVLVEFMAELRFVFGV